MRRHVAYVDSHLQEVLLEVRIAHDLVHRVEQCLDLVQHAAHLIHQGIEPLFLLANQVVAVAEVDALVLARQDVDELLTHDTRRGDCDGRALRDLGIPVDVEGDSHAAAVVADALDLADRHAREAHDRLRLDADDLLEARVERIALMSRQGNAGEQHGHRHEEHDTHNGERAYFCLCRHILSSFSVLTVRSVRKNACTRGSSIFLKRSTMSMAMSSPS